MRVTAFFTSLVIALDFLRWAGTGLAHHVKHIDLLVLGFLGAALAALLLGLRLCKSSKLISIWLAQVFNAHVACRSGVCAKLAFGQIKDK